MTFREDMKSVSAELIDILGEPAVYTGASGPFDITVIFEPEVLGANPYTGEIANTGPVAYAKTADVAQAKHKDTLTVDGVQYEILKAEDDGYGVTTLTLNKL